MFNLLAIPSYFEIGGMNIALLDIIALVVLLIFLIIGIVKGFSDQILSLLGWVAAIVVAIFTCTHAAEFLSNQFPDLVETIQSWWSDVIGEQFASVTDKESLRVALENSSLPAFLHDTIIELVGEEFTTIVYDISATLTNWTFIAVSFIIIFLLSWIVFKLIRFIFSKITNLPIVKQIDKTLGAILGIIKGLVLLLVLTFIFSLFPWFNDLLTPVAESGEAVTCYLNEVFKFIFELPFIKDALAGLI